MYLCPFVRFSNGQKQRREQDSKMTFCLLLATIKIIIQHNDNILLLSTQSTPHILVRHLPSQNHPHCLIHEYVSHYVLIGAKGFAVSSLLD